MCAQGIKADIVARFPEWHFNATQVQVWAAKEVPVSEHPNALTNSLRQLQGLHAPGATVALKGWGWSTPMLRIVAAAQSDMPHFTFTLDGVLSDPQLTDELLGVALQLGSSMQGMLMGAVELQSDTHANTPWPWEDFRVDALHVTRLLRLPDPGQAKSPRQLRCCHVHIDSSVEQVGGLQPLKIAR